MSNNEILLDVYANINLKYNTKKQRRKEFCRNALEKITYTTQNDIKLGRNVSLITFNRKHLMDKDVFWLEKIANSYIQNLIKLDYRGRFLVTESEIIIETFFSSKL